MRLEEHEVIRAEEVVEARLKEIRRTGIARNMPSELAVCLVRTDHHCQRIPAHQRSEPLLDGQVAGESRLLLHRDRVDIRSSQFRAPPDMPLACEFG
ncbi:hypothetical protein D3C72_1770510 [compost metagenome]